MARRSLRRELNQIRSWVEDGRTDAWIAHQLEISVSDLRAFKDEHGLVKGATPEPPPLDTELDFDDEVETESEAEESEGEPDDEPTEEAEEEEEEEEEEEDDADAEEGEDRPRAPLGDVRTSRIAAEEEADERGARSPRGGKGGSKGQGSGSGSGSGSRTRRRGGRGRGGRGRGGRRASSYEATFDHGGEGYGLWLDPSVESDPTYAEHWAGHRAVRVTIEPDSIVIRRDSAEEEEAV